MSSIYCYHVSTVSTHPLDALGDAEIRATLLYARSQAHPVTADDVADARGVHRNVARGRLERLAKAGLLIASFERRTGRSGPGAGRPAKIYRVAPELSAIEFPERRYERLVGLLAGELTERARTKRLGEAGAAFGRELAREARLRPARRLGTALERLCAALGRLGFQASVVDVAALTAPGAVKAGSRATIATSTCPLRPVVRAQPELAALDRRMWEALVGAALEGAGRGEVACETHRCLDDRADCRVVVTHRVIDTASQYKEKEAS